jgi:hypothetical protein
MNEHTIIFDRDEIGIAGIHCSFCKYRSMQGGDRITGVLSEENWKHSFKNHSDQYEPDRAPDIDYVEYEVDVDCTVCPPREGDVVITKIMGTQVPDGLECLTCGTTWNADGNYGTRKLSTVDASSIIDPNQMTIDEIPQ